MKFGTSGSDQHENKPAEGPEERGFSSVWFQLKERFQSGFMAMVKGGWGSSLCSPPRWTGHIGTPWWLWVDSSG